MQPITPHPLVSANTDGHSWVSGDIAEILKSALRASAAPGAGLLGKGTQIKIQPPDVDSLSYEIRVAIDPKHNSLESLPTIEAFERHLIHHLAKHDLTIDTPGSYNRDRLRWEVKPTQSATLRATLVAEQEAYKALEHGAYSNADGGGGIMDELANTPVPDIPTLMARQLEDFRETATHLQQVAELKDWEFPNAFTGTEEERELLGDLTGEPVAPTVTVTPAEQLQGHINKLRNLLAQAERIASAIN